MKTRSNILFIIAVSMALLITACNQPNKDSNTKPIVEHKSSLPTYEFHPAWNAKLQVSGMTGGVYVFNPNQNKWNVSDTTQLNQSYMPASTFKVVTSMLALELGLVKDENEVLPWDKVETDKPDWNRDMNMREALKLSTNWFYEGLVEEIGKDRMKQWLDKMEYPCNSIEDRDKFWIEEGFEVTPAEQIEFFARLHDNQLPFAQRTMDITKSIMLRYDTLGVKIFAKTGWGTPSKQNVGWYVGWVEKDNDVNYFATCIQQPDPNSENFGSIRIELTLDALKSLGIIPNQLVQ